MPIKGTSLFATKPISSPPPITSTTGTLASAPPNIFGGSTETSGTCAFSGGGSGCGGSTIAVA